MNRFQLHFSSVLWVLSIITGIVVVIAMFSSFTVDNLNAFFVTDTLYLPSIFIDLFVDKNGLQGWHFNPSPNFFPDMLAYFLLMFVFNDFVVVSFVFPVLQVVAINIITLLIFRLIIPKSFYQAATISNLFLLLFLFVFFFASDFWFSYYLISNSYHTGAFTMAYLCLYLTLRFIHTGSAKNLTALYIISILCVISDRLFIVLYNLPVFSLFIFYKKFEDRKITIRLLIMNVVTLILGLKGFRILKNLKYIEIDEPYIILEPSRYKDSLNVFYRQMKDYVNDLNLKTLIIILSIISFAVMIGVFISRAGREKKFSLFTFFLFFSIVYFVLVMAAPFLNGNYTGYDSLRYNIYSFYIAIINIGILIIVLTEKFFTDKKNKYVLNFASVLVIFITLIFGIRHCSKTGFGNYLNYYPKIAQCIDQIAEDYNLKHGVGDYWLSKPVTLFSKSGVRVYSIFDNLVPYYHVMNENWYYNDTEFQFIILNNKKELENIQKIFNRDDNFQIIHTPCFDVVKVRSFKYNKTDLKPYIINGYEKNGSE